MIKRNSISILLGAGFSKPAGYPLAFDLGNSILKSKNDSIYFDQTGKLLKFNPKHGKKHSPSDFFNSFNQLHLLLIEFLKTNNEFNYEEFYDFLLEVLQKKRLNEDDTIEAHTELTVFENIRKIYPQLVCHYLTDFSKNNNYWQYQGRIGLPIIHEKYKNFINFLYNESKNSEVNVHSLNHDLLFESFVWNEVSDFVFSDGFTNVDSPYYHKTNYEKIPLQYFSNIYTENLRFFKLHGSLDYYLFYNESGEEAVAPENYIKKPLQFSDIENYKKSDNGVDFQSWFAYHSEMMIGIEAKKSRYSEKLLFNELINHFKQNLKKADTLIIIGYSGIDDYVNQILVQNSSQIKKCIIIDPKPSLNLQNLNMQLKAKIIEKSIEEIDFFSQF